MSVTPATLLVNGSGVFVPTVVSVLVYTVTSRILQVAADRFSPIEKNISLIAFGITVLTGHLLKDAYKRIAIFQAYPQLYGIATFINGLAVMLLVLPTLFSSGVAVGSPSSLTNMIEKGKKGEYDELIGRDSEIALMEAALQRRPHLRSMVLVGESQSRPLIVVEECARRIGLNRLPANSPLQNKTIYYVDLLSVVFNQDERVKVSNLCQKGNVILVVTDIERLLNENFFYAASFLKSKVETGQVTLIGTTTKKKQTKVRESDWLSQFSMIEVGVFSASDCFTMMRRKWEVGKANDAALALAVLFSYDAKTKGFSLNTALNAISDILHKLTPQVLQGDNFFNAWKELYLKQLMPIDLSVLDEQWVKFFAQYMDVDSIRSQMEVLNRQIEDVLFNQTTPPAFLTDMVVEARRGKYKPCIGNERVIDRTIQTLRKSDSRSLVLIGEPGIGKTTVPREIVRKIVEKDPAVFLISSLRFYLLNMNAFIGHQYAGELRTAVNELIKFCQQRKGRIVIVIDEVDQLNGAGVYHNHPQDVADYLKEAMGDNEVVIMGMANPTNWKVAALDMAFARRFEEIEMDPPAPLECLHMLKHVASRGIYTKDFNPVYIEVTEEGIRAAIYITETLLKQKFLPDKATSLISAAASHYQLQLERQSSQSSSRKKIGFGEIAAQLHRQIKLQQPMTQAAFIAAVQKGSDAFWNQQQPDAGDSKEQDLI